MQSPTEKPPEVMLHRIARLLCQSFLYSLPFVLATALALLIVTRTIMRDTLTLLLFLEGGIGLLAGVGISLSNSPSMSRTGELLFSAAAWSCEGERHAQRFGLKWILSSAFLILIGMTISML